MANGYDHTDSERRRPSSTTSVEVPIAEVTVGPRRRAVDPARVAELAASIRAVGLLSPIAVTPEHRLVAGAHRLDAARALGWTTIPAIVIQDPDRAALVEIDENLMRADLSLLERGEHLAARKAIYERLHPETVRGVAGARARWDANETVSFASESAGVAKVSPRTVQQDVRIATRLAEDVRDVLRGTELADAKRELLTLTSFDADTQRAIVANLTGRTPKALRIALRAASHAQRASAQRWPTGRYGVIYCDPPWRYEQVRADTRAPEHHYPTMTHEELLALAPTVQAIAADDCVLVMWATTPKDAEAHELVKAWGFTYRTGWAWIKPAIGMGHWVRQQHELLKLAVRGEPMTPADADRPSSVIRAPRTRHSEKPACVYTMLERMFPSVPKVELFARTARPGWATWGNEVLDHALDNEDHAGQAACR